MMTLVRISKLESLKPLLLLFISVGLLWMCCKENLDEVCCDAKSSFTYKGATDLDTLLWEIADSFTWYVADRPDDYILISPYRTFNYKESTFFFSEVLDIAVPMSIGDVDPQQDPQVRYSQVFEDYLGDKYSIDTTQNNHLEVICIDTITKMISVSFDLHFVLDEEPSYPFAKQVSFTDGLFCGSYADN